ncbi:hypothetical protein [uncultured Metabacillus sp.]|uniref:hypothetical protein n=1 Tax=uncultured Metabacillus sp. TaxID=2860135 RepID=UPI00260AE977|nr:hypothetical protein [uncultured Metabacillus sp.]
MVQKEVLIGDIVVPIIEDGGDKYYPISYVSDKVLLRKGNVILQSNYETYKDKIKIFTLDYSFINGGIQEVKCVNEQGLKDVLKKSKIGRLNVEQRKAMNILLRYLNVEQVSEDEQFINCISEDELNNYSLFIKDAIVDVLKEYPNTKFQRCSKCNTYYPLHENFFKLNLNSSKEFDTYCRDCNRWDENRARDFVRRNDMYLSRINMKYGEETYKIFRDHKVIDIYLFYIDNLNTIPPIIKNKEDYLEIIKYIINKDKLNIYDISSFAEFNKKYRLQAINNLLSMNELYTDILGDLYYLEAWKYKQSVFKHIELTYEIANKVFDNYINKFNIKIDDMFKFNYDEICKKAGIRSLTDGNILYFIVQYNDFKYPGYKYKTVSPNYYKEEKNLLFDLKWLIVNDMKLQVEKIPLYLTNYTLTKKARSLYNYIVVNDNGNLFHWINKIYPDQFTELDFDVNFHRNEFDSLEEARINDLLEEKFENVIYNKRKGSRSLINIDSMQPDWIIVSKSGCWFIEYFGMYIERQKDNSTRIKDYIDKTHRKIEKYNQLENYKCLFLYPEDIENDFLGCREKLERIE